MSREELELVVAMAIMGVLTGIVVVRTIIVTNRRMREVRRIREERRKA